MGQVALMDAEGARGARWAEGSAGGGRSLKRKSRHSGRFWFNDPKVRPDTAFGREYRDQDLVGLSGRASHMMM